MEYYSAGAKCTLAYGEWHALHKNLPIVKPTIANKDWLPPHLISKVSGTKRAACMIPGVWF